jgi:hypothetical protein
MTVIFWQPPTDTTASPGWQQFEAYVELKKGTLYRQYAKANPLESSRVDRYWNGDPARPTVNTATGRALLGWADVYRGF